MCERERERERERYEERNGDVFLGVRRERGRWGFF
jgi:hypothetical protein